MNDAWRKLITGLVDGELGPAERQAAEKLLRQSAEARLLYSELRRQSDLLKALPKLKSPIDLAPETLARIRSTKPRPARPITLPFRRTYLQYAAAAAAVLGTLVGTWLLWSRFLEQDRLAEESRRSRASAPTQPRRVDDRPRLAGFSREEILQSGRKVAAAVGGAAAAVVAGMSEEAVRTARRQSQDAATALRRDRLLQQALAALSGQPGPAGVGKPVRELARPFKRLDFTLPAIASGEELTKDLKRFAAAAKPGSLHQFDLVSRDPHKTVERLVKATESRQVKVVVDAEAQAALKQKRPATFHIYLENVSADAFEELLAAFAVAEDAGRQAAEATLVSALIDRMPQESSKQLAANLGVPSASLVSGGHGDLPMPDPKAPPPDLNKPTAALPGGGPTAGAILYTYKPDRAGKFQSKEVKAFLEHRSGPHPDRLTLLIVIRAEVLR